MGHYTVLVCGLLTFTGIGLRGNKMIQTIRENFSELLIWSAVVTAILCFTFGLSYNNMLETKHEQEMAKLGCQQEILPGGYHNWKCPAKDR